MQHTSLTHSFSSSTKPHKLTSKDINYLCLKKTELGKHVSTIEVNLSKLAKLSSSKEIDLKKYFNYYARERHTIRAFYNSRVMSRERRIVELRTARIKNCAAAKERRFVKGNSKILLLFSN